MKSLVVKMLIVMVLVGTVVFIMPSIAEARERTCGDMFNDCVGDLWWYPGVFVYCGGGYVFCRKYMM